MKVLETSRLNVRRMKPDDAAFMLRLLNNPSWLNFIGDRGVRTLEDARRYIENGPMGSYERFGFGFYIVELKDDGTPIGMCGLAQRDYLDAPDIGYALMPEFAGHGYAFEAAAGVLDYARTALRLPRMLATTRTDNASSSRVLEKLGMRHVGMVNATDVGRELMLYRI